MTGRSVTVLRTGPLALVQDLGRPGLGHLAVPPSGAVDPPALRLANELVGNGVHAAGIEALLGGVTLRASGPCLVAVTGAPVRVSLAGEPAAFASALRLPAGEQLRLGTPHAGLRCYLAVSGGLAVPAELGSRSSDTLSGIGPAPLSAGQVLPLGEAGDPPGPTGASTLPALDGPVELPVLLGPRDDWFADAARQLRDGRWTVSPHSNRIGVRLQGTALCRRHGGELPTEPMITGAVQVPPSGQPLIFLNDHPTTGGYPVIAVVVPAALPALAQARPGTAVRLQPTSWHSELPGLCY